MGKRYVKNGMKVNKHGIPIGIRDIEEIVDEIDRKERKAERQKTKRESFVESIKSEINKEPEKTPEIKYVPDSKYIEPYRKYIENVFARKAAVRTEENKRMELLKIISKMQQDKEER